MRVWEGEEAAARPVDASAVHRRSAAKLYRLCERNGGIYIKLGQHLAQLDYLLPDEYCEAMRPLLNACPTQPLSEVEATLREDLGITSLTEAFAEFEPQPIASASLAQVHRARLRPDRIHEANASDDGASAFPLVVAVKVQHRGLAEACQGDIATVQFLVTAAQRLFPGSFDYQWLVDEIRDNLPRELDFQLERCNGERCAHQLHTVRDADGRERARPRPDVRVPQFLPQLSSHRVLTMSYEHGVPVHDVNGIQRLGLRLRDVAAVVNDVFTDQIFIHGFVHSDPHAGNILVRPRDDDASRPLIVLLDHGLYRELDDTFRLRYAALWQGIVGGDSRGIRTQALAMGVPEADVELFTSMLTTRSWREVRGRQTAGAGVCPRAGAGHWARAQSGAAAAVVVIEDQRLFAGGGSAARLAGEYGGDDRPQGQCRVDAGGRSGRGGAGGKCEQPRRRDVGEAAAVIGSLAVARVVVASASGGAPAGVSIVGLVASGAGDRRRTVARVVSAKISATGTTCDEGSSWRARRGVMHLIPESDAQQRLIGMQCDATADGGAEQRAGQHARQHSQVDQTATRVGGAGNRRRQQHRQHRSADDGVHACWRRRRFVGRFSLVHRLSGGVEHRQRRGEQGAAGDAQQTGEQTHQAAGGDERGAQRCIGGL
eukprot:ctg_777.g365